MNARQAVLQVLENRKTPIERDLLLYRVTCLTKRNLSPASLAVVISNLRKDGFSISRGPRFVLEV